MNIEGMKKGICTLKLEKLKKIYNELGEIDPTVIGATFSILDFNTSGNKQLVSKTVALAGAYTLKNKPLLAGYTETTDFDNPNDDFTDHEEQEIKLRDGSDYTTTKTHAIGVCPDKAYLGVIKDEEGNDLDVLLADFVLWAYRYPNEVMLINDFYEKGEPLYSSCEFFYTSSKVENGVEVIDKLYFDGHTVLGRNVEPAYSSSRLVSFNSKWTKAINELKTCNNKSEDNSDLNTIPKEEDLMENIFLKSMNDLSFGDIRDGIYAELANVMVASEYSNLWISSYNIFEDSFMYETRIDGVWVNYKVPYTKGADDKLTIAFDQKTEVTMEFKAEWVPVAEMTSVMNSLEEVKTSLNAKDAELVIANEATATLQTQLNEKEETIKALNSKVEATTEEKNVTMEKFNELAETVTSLNSKVVELQPLADEYNKEQLEKSLNSAKEFYKEKFANVDSMELFEKEETQELILKSINSNATEAQTAKFSLNDLIIANIKPLDEKPNVSLNAIQPAVVTKDLTSTVDSFTDFYGFSK